jgi:hypothetical protein
MGFTASKTDTSLFIFRSQQAVIYFLIYVDDIIIIKPYKFLLHSIITNLQQDFPLKDLEDLHYFLGIEALQDDRGLFLSQQKYIFDLLEKTNMLHAKLVNSLMSTTDNLSLFKGDPFSNPTLYRSTVGSLQYLSFTTRPRICRQQSLPVHAVSHDRPLDCHQTDSLLSPTNHPLQHSHLPHLIHRHTCLLRR